MTPEMDENERLVREAWEHVSLKKDFGWHVWLGGFEKGSAGSAERYFFSMDDTKAGAWAAARAFTDQRKEELRLLHEEIALQTLYRDARQQLSDSDYDGPIPIEVMQLHVTVLGRTLLRLTGIREELSRGMKG